MANSSKVEAIVLKKRNLPGNDCIITLFTPSDGKVAVMAKGIKKITSRRAAHIQTGNLLSVMLNDSKGRYYLQETNLISGFTGIKADEDKMRCLYFMFFILDRLLPDLQPETEVYKLLKRFMVDLTKSEFTRTTLAEYGNKVLGLLGYQKQIQNYTDLMRYIEEIIHEKIPGSII